MTPRLVLAPNPGPMTLTGTNTWLLDGDRGTIVIDPGPLIGTHLDAICAASGPIAEIWLTHRHVDHIEAALPLSDRVGGVPVRAWDPALCRGGEPLRAGQRIPLRADTVVHVLHVPGHTDDSIGFVHISDGTARLLTGDMVLGTGTTVIVPPDGSLSAYFSSLDIMEAACVTHQVAELLPAHGPVHQDPVALLRHYRAHRLERLAQVRAAVAAGNTTPEAVVEVVYTDAPEAVKFAARLSAAAQLEYLRAETA